MADERPARVTDERIERLANALLNLAGDESVRVLEALAAALVNRLEEDDEAVETAAEALGELRRSGLFEAPAAWVGESDERLALCRRIARRALRGSLLDPTGGATAFHRIDASPAWARRLMPLAVCGSFLFYRR